MQVDEGNRLKRAIVGFGSGSSEVLVQVAVYDLVQSRDHPILVYGTGTARNRCRERRYLESLCHGRQICLSRNATRRTWPTGKQIAKDSPV